MIRRHRYADFRQGVTDGRGLFHAGVPLEELPEPPPPARFWWSRRRRAEIQYARGLECGWKDARHEKLWGLPS